MVIHVVKPNETVNSIAAYYGLSADRIIYDNELYTPNRLAVGQALLLLFPEVVHTVVQNDTLYSISQAYGISVLQIVRNNPYLLDIAQLEVGQNLVIQYTDEPIRDIRINGYAYPYIDTNILRETLLYLTDLSIFSYGFTTAGELIPPSDNMLIETAQSFGVNPILVLTPLTEDGTFNNQLVKIVTNDLEVQNNLIQNVLETVQAKGYEGVDVDFEFILPEDRVPYAEFIANIAAVMNENGYPVSVALAPKTSAIQQGLLYEGMDYRLIGESANSVLLMTYEWGYTYGPPMAVAPINKVREVLDYAVTEIPNEKIDMGIPNYGYDWALPFQRGITRADSISNPQAVQIAVENNAIIQFDEVAMSPFFEYRKDGVDHIVWFEDARSIYAKLRLIEEYNFRGAGYWNIMKPFRQNWLLANALFRITPGNI